MSWVRRGSSAHTFRGSVTMSIPFRLSLALIPLLLHLNPIHARVQSVSASCPGICTYFSLVDPPLPAPGSHVSPPGNNEPHLLPTFIAVSFWDASGAVPQSVALEVRFGTNGPQWVMSNTTLKNSSVVANGHIETMGNYRMHRFQGMCTATLPSNYNPQTAITNHWCECSTVLPDVSVASGNVTAVCKMQAADGHTYTTRVGTYSFHRLWQ